MTIMLMSISSEPPQLDLLFSWTKLRSTNLLENLLGISLNPEHDGWLVFDA